MSRPSEHEQLIEVLREVLQLLTIQAEARKGFDLAQWLDERSLKCGHGYVICARCGFLPPSQN